MVIIETQKFKTQDEYIASLSKRARHEFTLISKRNADVTYQNVPFDKEKIHRFMQLWEKQLVRGQPIQWAYPVETVQNWYDKGELLVFEANSPTETLAMHFIQKQDGFWEAHSPMWDKSSKTQRHLGTYMWFHLVLWGIENNLGILNFGGGIDSWREMIKRRKEFRNPLYKWRFVPKAVKDNPDLQPNYEIHLQHERKVLRNI